jgi:hypothetical protein
MIRARFLANSDDYRPVKWPPPGPYWCSGYDPDDIPIVIAYAKDQAEILQFWPEATKIDVDECETYTFTNRFPKPEWFNP